MHIPNLQEKVQSKETKNTRQKYLLNNARTDLSYFATKNKDKKTHNAKQNKNVYNWTTKKK